MNNNYISVTDINRYIKSRFESDNFLQRVFVKGEISNFKYHSSGHLYFTLKDEGSRINAVMFSFNAKSLKFMPKDGMKVLVSGKINLYEPNGNYQIYIDKMENDGLGILFQKYEELKTKLDAEGLFKVEHKKKIPKFPKKIGIVTAPTGAAIRDILSTIKRRYPICETILFPSLVQGEGAKESIVKMLTLADSYNLDVIILGRGGGSIEDLWAFNEEIVARAVYACNTPIISGVGHEIDFTICDFVADLRAPTPTGAAEIAVPNIVEVKNYLNQINIRCNNIIKNYLYNKKTKLNNITNSYILKNPLNIYEIKMEKTSHLVDKVQNIIDNLLSKERNDLALNINKLKLLNPLNILDKGYSVIKKEDKIIKNATDLNINDMINIKFSKGKINARVENIEKE